MILLEVKEVEFFFSLLRFYSFALGDALVNRLRADFQLQVSVVLFCALGLKFGDALFELGLTVLSLQLLAHGEGHTRLVQGLVRSDGHLDLVTDSKQQQAALWLRQGHLADNLVEALSKKFFTHGANARLARLSLHKFLVEHLAEASNVDSAGRLVRHVLDIVLAALDPLSRRQDAIEDVLGGGALLQRWQLALLL